MRLIRPGGLAPVAWKNGGGVTREIARLDRGEATVWRLSLADVDRDGPFSPFPGMERILTVVAGAGMVLETRAGPLQALPETPLAFSGALEVVGRLSVGSVRNLNLIFDPVCFAANVSRLAGRAETDLDPAEGGTAGLYVLGGTVTATGGAPVPPGSVALCGDGPARVRLAPDARALWLDLAPLHSDASSEAIAAR
ncbi:MAG: HutD family protein [Geminicoccaceae bacterium]|nr:HutD family protein [Geminicoccaceae bacterium]